ncbi:MAG: sigma-70 family RNA polymerase sigma factor [Acidobacteria bacterium]|nr:sigma-70 family RNA polymerase sigma factor [Acidobacteriota bacterium]
MAGPARAFEAEGADSDEALVDRAKRGDQEGIRLLVEKYERRVIGLGWGLLGSRQDAEDVAQEAFLRAFRSIGSFRGQSSFRTWLFQIAINAARTYRRTREGRHEDAKGGAMDFDTTAAAGSLERAVIARDRVRRALATLPAELREAVVLRDVNGLDYREIAEALGVPMGTVESRIFRGRARLKQALDSDTVPEGARR